ncbi:MAG: hypothetical protein R2825_21645 [Saprospiraceae bacterium]
MFTGLARYLYSGDLQRGHGNVQRHEAITINAAAYLQHHLLPGEDR